MIKHYLFFIYRLFKKQAGSYGFNILGLSLGFFAALSALYLATMEFRYNANYKESENIYRILTKFNKWDAVTATSAFNLSPTLLNSYPEVTEYNRIKQLKVQIKLADQELYEGQICFVDTSFFSFFDQELILGNKNKVLENSESVVITKEYAKKYFGNSNPIGQIITINWEDYSSNLTIKGIVENPNVKSTIKYNILGNIALARKFLKKRAIDSKKSNGDGWVDMNYESYVKVTENTIVEKLIDKINNQGIKDCPNYFDLTYLLQPLSNIYLSNIDVLYDSSPHGNKKYTLILLLTGFILLTVSCFNYIILSTSQAVLRTKEFGIRKVFGATKKQIIIQIISEYIIYSLLSLFIALSLIYYLYPIINSWFGRNVTFSLFSNFLFIPGLILVLVITVFFSTFYLNVYIAKSKPITAITGIQRKISSKFSIHNILVGLQLTFFCVVFTFSIIAHKQVKFIANKDLGINPKNLIVISNSVIHEEPQKFLLFKSKLSQSPKVVSITSANSPTLPSQLLPYFPFKVYDQEGQSEEIYCDLLDVNYDFLETFGISLIEGADFREKNSSSYNNYCLVTESGVKAFNLEEPLGTILTVLDGEMYTEIIGVVKDFYVSSFYNKPNPIVLIFDPDIPNDYYIRTQENININSIIQYIENTWKEIFPEQDFNYRFYEDEYERLYGRTNSTIKIVVVFLFFAIFLSLFGLYGTSFHISKLRVKELALRKLFGASLSNNLTTIMTSFIRATVAANVIAAPASIYITKLWLEQFAIKINFPYATLIFTLMASFLIMFVATSNNLLKIINKPIIESLKEKE